MKILHIISLSLSLPPLNSGGINYTISGENLDSVQEPHLLIYYDGVPSGGKKRRQIMQEGRFISEVCQSTYVCTCLQIILLLSDKTIHSKYYIG